MSDLNQRQGTKVKFSSKCDIFSSSMLMWKIASKGFYKDNSSSWQNDPMLRPGLHELFNQLYTLTQKYPLKEFTTPTRKFITRK
ncbi:unnamed protein product [Rhizophagus irregularis]|nr:unnamed protein product [Rhizophagus irregularis]